MPAGSSEYEQPSLFEIPFPKAVRRLALYFECGKAGVIYLAERASANRADDLVPLRLVQSVRLREDLHAPTLRAYSRYQTISY